MKHDPRLIANARQLRRDLSPAEKLLWREVRGRRFAGYRFRRQHPFEPYVLDFYCAACRLVIELDGESHLGNEEADRRRQKYLEDAGLKVLRFWNTEVFDEFDSVLEAIYQECQARVNRPLASAPQSPAERGER